MVERQWKDDLEGFGSGRLGHWVELKVSHFIIYIVKMSLDRPATFKIIVPAASSAKSLSAVAPEPQEEAKTVRQTKLYIVPKHRSHPLSLDIQQRPGEERKFTPSFDSFELGRLFSGKKLTQEEQALFASLREIDEDKFKTPQREAANAEKGWSSFRLVDSHLHSTTTSNKAFRSLEVKKSRPKEKGLRKLSQRAYEIVLNMRSASYKEVANRLVDELNSEQQLDQEGKDQQNIKRRVYDALNVLIALGVLRKEGRKIVGDRENQLHFSQSMIARGREEFQQKIEQIKSKHQKIKNLQEKYNIYKELKKIHGKKQESLEHREENKIYFPFLALNSDGESSVRGQRGDDGAFSQITMRWVRGANDWGHFDVDLLVEYNRALGKMDQS